MTRRFELTVATSKKFWEITVADAWVTVQYGRIGTNGRRQMKAYPTAADAAAAATTQVTEKTHKGYHEVTAAPGSAPPQSGSQPTTPPRSASTAADRGVDRRQLAAIRKLVGQWDHEAVRQGIALLRALDDPRLWALMAEEPTVLMQSLLELRKHDVPKEIPFGVDVAKRG